MKSLPRFGALLPALLLAVAGCRTTAADPEPAPLTALPEGSAWALSGSDVAGLDVEAAGRVTLQVEDGRLAGNSGCNGFSAAYTLVDGRLSLGPVMATKRACLGPEADVERALFAALAQLNEARLVEGSLVLRGADGSELRFAPAPAESQ